MGLLKDSDKNEAGFLERGACLIFCCLNRRAGSAKGNRKGRAGSGSPFAQTPDVFIKGDCCGLRSVLLSARESRAARVRCGAAEGFCASRR